MRPALYGRVLDSLTGLPLRNLHFTNPGQGIARSDSLGRYLLFDLPVGVHAVSFFCPTKRIWWGRPFATRPVAVTARTDSVLDFRLRVRGCKEPPLRTWTGEFRGHYQGGFEISHFVPCTPFQSLEGTAYEDSTRTSAWVSFSPDARMLPFPSGGDDQDPDGLGTFVRWKARVTGPGRYGHMGVGMYDMLVTNMLEARAARPGDCSDRAGPPPD
jgi:hypothetical protein